MSLKECRICFDKDNQEDMIAPCNCSGSSKYVHRECLDKWRAQNPSNDNFNRCNQCLFNYVLENPRAVVSEAVRKKKLTKANTTSIVLMYTSCIFVFIVTLILIKTLDYNNIISSKLQSGHFILSALLVTFTTAFILYKGNIRMSVIYLYVFLIFGFNIRSVMITIIYVLAFTSVENSIEYIRSENSKNISRIWSLSDTSIERVRDLDQ